MLTAEEQSMFDADVDEFFGILFDQMGQGEITTDEARCFFPQEVQDRCSNLENKAKGENRG